MTKNKALFAWLNDFMTFYRDTAVPEDAEFPYGTYDYVETSFDGGEVSITVNLWFRTESEATPDEAANDLSERIGYGGALVSCDDGFIWLKKGSPWCQSVLNESDTAIKRRYINLTAEYLTFN